MKKPITHSCAGMPCGVACILKAIFTESLALMLLVGWSAEVRSETGCTMACNNLVSVSLPAVCEAEITHDMILEGSYQGCSPNDPTAFSVLVTYQGVPLPNSPFVNAGNIGQTLMVTVTHLASGNSCWGNLTVEDKLPPQLTCPADLTIACTADTSPVNTGYATAADCSDVTITYSSSTQNSGCNGPYSGTVTRNWTAFDEYGNWSQCTQVVRIASPQIGDVVFPPHLDGIQNPALDCVNPNTDPTSTGQPTVGGAPIPGGGGGYCNMAASHSDQTIPICENSYKILRNWVVVAWCSGEVKTGLQIIAVKDTHAPQVDCPADLTVSTNSSQSCTAALVLPAASISDDCSSTFWVTMQTPVGLVTGNGGYLFNVPLGTHTITYKVNDDCGNSSACTMTLTVADQSPPTVVCDAYTAVSLNNNGLAQVFAQTFDDGSYDNCTSVTFSVRRMEAACGTQPVFGPTVRFCCTDVGEDVQVELKVTDYHGNSNSCMVIAHVEDYTAPLLLCPSDVTLACTDDYGDLALTGEPTVTEACGLAEYFFEEAVDLNLCGVGTVVRTWTGIDHSGNTGTCSHTIHLTDSTPPVITFPPNYTVVNCTSPLALHPDSLPAPFNAPVISADCELMATSFTDQVFYVAPPSCFKILRTWKVINWCTYQPGGNTGLWEGAQLIMVNDETPPVITCPADVSVQVDTTCTATVVLPSVTGIQDCSQNIDVEVVTNIGFGAGPFGNVAPGSYGATYVVSDGCGNSSSCVIDIVVSDEKPPVPYCKNGLIIEIMNAQPPMVEVWAEDFDAGSFDNCSSALQFSFSANTDSTSMLLTCDNLGQTPVQIWVTDEAGNRDFCETFLILQGNLNSCFGPLVANVGGSITTEQGYSVQDVMVMLNDSINDMAMTDTQGNFTFQDLLVGFDYTVTPAKDTDTDNGVTTFDIVLIRRHILNAQLLDSPYKLIAADANNSMSITTADLVAIQKVVLHAVGTFPGNESWRFVDAAYQFPDPQNPWLEALPEVYNINDLSGDMNGVKFVALKVGDVNASASTNNWDKPASDRSGQTLMLRVNDLLLAAGDITRLDFRADNFEKIIGFQFTLRFDPAAVALEQIVSGSLPGLTDANFGLTMLSEGVITVSWNEVTPTSLLPGQALFSLVVKAASATQVSTAFALNSDFTVAEAYFEQGELLGVALEFAEGKAENTQGLSASAWPNPFDESTTIGFYNPEPQVVTLLLLDASGRVVWKESGHFGRGYDSFLLHRVNGLANEVYWYQLITAGEMVTGRLVRVGH